MSKSKTIEGSVTHHYVSARKKRGREEKSMQPPLTPMIDVTFQLLLYFILTAEFRQAEGGIPGTLPQEGGVAVESSDPRDPIRVLIEWRGAARDGVLYSIAGLPPIDSEQNLQAQLVKRRGSGKNPPPVVLQPSGDVSWGYVVKVFNAAVRAKFDEIGWVQTGS
jgi:biopolymer transport protein ExbD